MICRCCGGPLRNLVGTRLCRCCLVECSSSESCAHPFEKGVDDARPKALKAMADPITDAVKRGLRS